MWHNYLLTTYSDHSPLWARRHKMWYKCLLASCSDNLLLLAIGQFGLILCFLASRGELSLVGASQILESNLSGIWLALSSNNSPLLASVEIDHSSCYSIIGTSYCYKGWAKFQRAMQETIKWDQTTLLPIVVRYHYKWQEGICVTFYASSIKGASDRYKGRVDIKFIPKH